VPLSQIIRQRITARKARFHANDNIAEFIEPGEIEGLVDEVTQKLQGVLESLVIDTKSDHNTRGTAYRVAKMYVNEVFNGRYTPQPSLTRFPNISRLNELMIIGPIAVKSACSHHLCPIICAHYRVGDVSAPDSGRSSGGTSQHLGRKDETHWSSTRHGSRSLLHAMAWREGPELQDGQ
jgi:aldehyde:ferredoxin oxidoreductase